MSRKLKVLDLFSGVGAFSLGLERTNGFETIAFCENDPRCRAILDRHWPGLRCFGNIKSVGNGEWPDADVIVGGFPCQDVSRAGKRAGLSGTRSGLFWELLRAVRMVGPRYVLLENVAALIHDGLGTVCRELADSGYRVEWDCIPAYAVGAPHERDRIWIVAYADERERQDGRASAIRRWFTSKSKSKSKRVGVATDSNGSGKLQPGWMFRHFRGRPLHRGTGSDAWRENWLDRLGALRRMDDGTSRRLDEIKPCGNTLLPQIPELIGKAILESIKETA